MMNLICWSERLQHKTGDLCKGASQNKISLKEIQQCEGVDWIQQAQDRVQAGSCEYGYEPVGSIKRQGNS
jgi:hypothetical protein